jgi:hypothetical protein
MLHINITHVLKLQEAVMEAGICKRNILRENVRVYVLETGDAPDVD